MTIKKETELIHAIIVYCQRCQDEGDFPALIEMGFGPREVRALSSLSPKDALRLASTRSHFLTITVNQEIYWRMIDYLNREKTKEELIDELISNCAPLPLMHALIGMSSKQFTLKRRQFGLGSSLPGRPTIPTEDVAEKVWNDLKPILERSKAMGPAEFLELYGALQKEVPLRMIWHLFHQWDRDGTLKNFLPTSP